MWADIKISLNDQVIISRRITVPLGTTLQMVMDSTRMYIKSELINTLGAVDIHIQPSGQFCFKTVGLERPTWNAPDELLVKGL